MSRFASILTWVLSSTSLKCLELLFFPNQILIDRFTSSIFEWPALWWSLRGQCVLSSRSYYLGGNSTWSHVRHLSPTKDYFICLFMFAMFWCNPFILCLGMFQLASARIVPWSTPSPSSETCNCELSSCTWGDGWEGAGELRWACSCHCRSWGLC